MLISVIRPVPPQTVPFVKQHEGCRLTVYVDAAGVLTVGFGHTAASLRPGETITQEQADTFLAQDLATAAARLEEQIGSDAVGAMTDNQYAACCDFTFNLGTGPKAGQPGEWQIWQLLRAKQFAQAADQFSRFNKAGGKVLAGLVQRRADEQVLFLSGAPETVDDALPSSVTRAVDTPPTQIAQDPLSQSKRFVTSCAAACLTAASAAAPQVKGMADSVNSAISPYVGQSTVIAAISSHLALVAAGVAAAVPVLFWLQHRKAGSQ